MGDYRKLRSNTIHILEVKEEDRLPSRVLPMGKDVLKLEEEPGKRTASDVSKD